MLSSMTRCREGNPYDWYRACGADPRCAREALVHRPFVVGSGCSGGDPAANLAWFDGFLIDPTQIPDNAPVYRVF